MDGLSVRMLKTKTDWFKKTVSSVETKFNVKFEYAYYKKMILRNVNSYLAIDTDNKIKQKNEFVENPDLGNNIDFLIIPKALKAYYVDGIDYEKFIKEHKNIYDFCASKKVDKSYSVYWTSPDGIRSKQQRLNRFYASKKGGYLFKVRDGSDNHLLKDSGVMIYNNHKDSFPTDINYEFYINKVREIVVQLNNNNQLSLF